MTLAHDVSADESKAAWLLEIITPPQGGDSIDRISFDWLEGEGSPAETLRMPVFADLQDKFHLVAFDDAKLSDKGNKWRPDGMTHKKAFDDYITISKRFKSDQSAWVKCLPSKLNPPAPIYDYEKTQDCDAGNCITCHWYSPHRPRRPTTSVATLAHCSRRHGSSDSWTKAPTWPD